MGTRRAEAWSGRCATAADARKANAALWAALFAVLLATAPPPFAQATGQWSTPSPISRAEESASVPVLASDSSGAVHAFWVCRPRDRAATPTAICYSRFADNEWANAVDVMATPGFAGAYDPRAIVDRSGRLHLFWAGPPGEGSFNTLYHSWARVAAAGRFTGWSGPEVVALGTYQHDVRMDSEGRLHLVYASVLDDLGICHRVLGGAEGDWSDPNCVPRAPGVREQEHEVRPRLAIDSTDGLHVVWVLDDYSIESRLSYSGRAVMYAHSDDAGLNWTAPLVIDEIDGRGEYERSVDGMQPEWGNIVVDGVDRIHVVWVGHPDMSRYHQWSADRGATWSARQVVIPSGGYNGWQGLAVDGADQLHLVWPSLRGVEYVRWQSGSWSSPLLMSEVGANHNAQAVVALGNRLHAVWQDHGGGRDLERHPELGRVFWATLVTAAEGVRPAMVPTVAEQAAAWPTPETADERAVPAATERRRDELVDPVVGDSATASPSHALLFGVGCAALVVAVALVLSGRRR